MVSRIPDGVAADAPLLVVDDVLRALEGLGRAARARTKAKVVGITGSVGKTSTKEMLRAVLGGQGRVHAAEASYNNHWGVPLTLARMPQETEFAVIEIGMNHPGEIAPLARMADLDVAMITTVAPAHLEAFASVEGIAHEKASILDGLRAGGVAVLRLATAGCTSTSSRRSASLWVTCFCACAGWISGRASTGDRSSDMGTSRKGAGPAATGRTPPVAGAPAGRGQTGAERLTSPCRGVRCPGSSRNTARGDGCKAGAIRFKCPRIRTRSPS